MKSSKRRSRVQIERGKQFVNLVRQASASWTGDSATLLQLCKAAVFGVAQQAAPAAPAAAVAPAAPAAPVTPDAISQAKKASFLDTALLQAAHQPSGGANTVQSDTGPVSVTQTELEDMFLRDFQAANTAA